MTKKLYKSCNISFRIKYADARISDSSTILRLVKKVCWTGSVLDKKCARQNAVLCCAMKAV
jgi:hypothetical protein